MADNEIVKPTGLLMPEIILYNTINSILNIVREDFAQNDLQDTIIYQMFAYDECEQPIEIDNWNYLKQAKRTFIENSQNLQVNLGYNMSVTDKACIHIILPNETGRPLGIGADENYQGYVQSQDGNAYQAILTEMFDASYNIIITSENTMEVLLIYNFLKAAFISLYAHIELSGLRLPKISGADIQLQSDLVPTHIFHRSLSISFMYEFNVPELMRKRLIKKFKVSGISCIKESNKKMK